MEPLTIRQTNVHNETTTITIEELSIYCSRVISNKLYKICVNLDGTIGDLGAKVNRVAKLDNEMFIELSRIHSTNDAWLSINAR